MSHFPIWKEITTGKPTLSPDSNFKITANPLSALLLVPGSGMANISNTGLVTAQSNGTVWAKATTVS
jgi:hypothetical protein